MTEAMLFLQKTILLSYDPRPFLRLFLFLANLQYTLHQYIDGCIYISVMFCMAFWAYPFSYF